MTPVEILENLARHIGVRVESCEHFSPNVGEWCRRQVRAQLCDYSVRVFLGDYRVEIEVKGINTKVSFSANAPDRICLLKYPLSIPGAKLPCPIFVASYDTQPTIAWFQIPRNASLLMEFDLKSEESIQVYRNGIILIGHPERTTRDTISRLCDLADCLPGPNATGLVDGLSFAVENLPEQLQPLAPLIRQFAVGDDVERTEILNAASPAELRQLVRMAGPLLTQINTFLNSFGDRPLSNEAMLLGNLAEAVAELGCHEA